MLSTVCELVINRHPPLFRWRSLNFHQIDVSIKQKKFDICLKKKPLVSAGIKKNFGRMDVYLSRKGRWISFPRCIGRFSSSILVITTISNLLLPPRLLSLQTRPTRENRYQFGTFVEAGGHFSHTHFGGPSGRSKISSNRYMTHIVF